MAQMQGDVSQTVVPVEANGDNANAHSTVAATSPPSSAALKAKSAQLWHPPPLAHQIVSGAGDEHFVITTPGGQARRREIEEERRRHPPKFSQIVNEYMGACLDDNCNIGETGTRASPLPRVAPGETVEGLSHCLPPIAGEDRPTLAMVDD